MKNNWRLLALSILYVDSPSLASDFDSQSIASYLMLLEAAESGLLRFWGRDKKFAFKFHMCKNGREQTSDWTTGLTLYGLSVSGLPHLNAKRSLTRLLKETGVVSHEQFFKSCK